MKTIKQPKGSGMCTVCVAAMLTDTCVEDVYAFLNDGRIMGDPMSDAELAAYLLACDMSMGRGWGFEEFPNKSVRVRDFDEIVFLSNLNGSPAYLAVKSKNYKDRGHAVVWDGQFVRDPDSRVPDTTPLGDYDIVQVWPLTYIDGAYISSRIQLTPREEPPDFVLRYRTEGIGELIEV